MLKYNDRQIKTAKRDMSRFAVFLHYCYLKVWIENNQSDKYQLDKEYKRHSPYKVPVLCFVAEFFHSDNASDASADYGKEEKRSFTYTPFMVFCALLVDTH